MASTIRRWAAFQPRGDPAERKWRARAAVPARPSRPFACLGIARLPHATRLEGACLGRSQAFHSRSAWIWPLASLLGLWPLDTARPKGPVPTAQSRRAGARSLRFLSAPKPRARWRPPRPGIFALVGGLVGGVWPPAGALAKFCPPPTGALAKVWQPLYGRPSVAPCRADKNPLGRHWPILSR